MNNGCLKFWDAFWVAGESPRLRQRMRRQMGVLRVSSLFCLARAR